MGIEASRDNNIEKNILIERLKEYSLHYISYKKYLYAGARDFVYLQYIK